MAVLEPVLTDPVFRWLLLIVFGAGIVRGFAGFGTGMIVGPTCAALYSPAAALIILFVMDLGPANVLVPQAWKKTVWREIVPLSLGAAVFLPAGLLFLVFGDPILLRWVISAVVLTLVVLLWWGVHYHGPRTGFVSFCVGGVAGFLSGFAGLPGPPVILYWMAARTGHGIVRANLIIFFAISEILSGIGLWLAGIFQWKYVAMGIVACAPYLAGLLIGSAIFGYASERTYRRAAFTLVLLAAVTSVPLLDGLLRS